MKKIPSSKVVAKTVPMKKNLRNKKHIPWGKIGICWRVQVKRSGETHREPRRRTTQFEH